MRLFGLTSDQELELMSPCTALYGGQTLKAMGSASVGHSLLTDPYPYDPVHGFVQKKCYLQIPWLMKLCNKSWGIATRFSGPHPSFNVISMMKIGWISYFLVENSTNMCLYKYTPHQRTKWTKPCHGFLRAPQRPKVIPTRIPTWFNSCHG